jgi:hypothetical protein
MPDKRGEKRNHRKGINKWKSSQSVAKKKSIGLHPAIFGPCLLTAQNLKQAGNVPSSEFVPVVTNQLTSTGTLSSP